jgi:hypothetical protein
MRPWLIFLIFLLEAWAIIGVLGTPRGTAGKAAWILGIILFPVVGVLAWLGWGQRTDVGALRMP